MVIAFQDAADGGMLSSTNSISVTVQYDADEKSGLKYKYVQYHNHVRSNPTDCTTLKNKPCCTILASCNPVIFGDLASDQKLRQSASHFLLNIGVIR
jgi:hypothetical protein